MVVVGLINFCKAGGSARLAYATSGAASLIQKWSAKERHQGANRTSADTWYLLISSVLIFLFRLFQLQTSNSNPIPNLSLSNGIHQTLASIFVSLERERERERARCRNRVLRLHRWFDLWSSENRRSRWEFRIAPVTGGDGEFHGGTRHERHAHRAWLGHEHRDLRHAQSWPWVRFPFLHSFLQNAPFFSNPPNANHLFLFFYRFFALLANRKFKVAIALVMVVWMDSDRCVSCCRLEWNRRL